MQARLFTFYNAARAGSFKSGRFLVPVALGVLALGLIYWRIVRGYSPPISYVPWPPPPGWVETLYSFRWAVRAILILAGTILLGMELLGGALSSWLQGVLAHQRNAILLTAITALLLGSYLIQPGFVGAGDAVVQQSSSGVVWDGIRDGQWLVYWTNYAYLGSPFGQFHNSLYYYVVVFANLFTRNIFYATEFSQLGLIVLSACFMYLYALQLTKSAPAALVTATIWSATFYRYHLIVILGKLPYGLFLCLWPLQFWLIEKIIERPTAPRRLWGALSLIVAMLLWTHVLYGVWLIALGLLYAVTRLLLPWPRADLKPRISTVAWIVLAHIAAILPATYQIVPTLIESNLTRMETFVGAREFSLPTIGLEHVLIFQDSYLANWFGGFVGNSIVILAILAIGLSLIQRSWQAFTVVVQLAVTLFMTFAPHYWPGLFDNIFQSLPLGQFAYAAKSPGIYLLVAIGPLTLLAGMFVQAVSQVKLTQQSLLSRLAGWLLIPERIALIVAAGVLLELIPLSLSVNFKYPDGYVDSLPDRQAIIEALAFAPDKTARVADVQAGVAGSYTIPILTGHPGLIGHSEEATAPANTIFPLITTLQAETASGVLSSQTTSLLYQLDVGYLITDSSVTKIAGLEKITSTSAAALWRVPRHAPLTANTSPTGDDVPVTITHYGASSITASLEFSLPTPAFVQVAYAAYPYQRVLLDGRSVEVIPTALGLIGIQVEAGQHSLFIEPVFSSLRNGTLIISLISTLGLMLITFAPLSARQNHRYENQPA